jgi:2-polyprenyl-3-methyl-5-hydroxy-6-metoxy-1,4-benzoquinol methylase
MNNSKVAEMWDNRYSETGYAYGRDPNDFLKASAKHIPMGNVLCLGAGEGRNAVYLAQKGYDVTAVDISEAGLNKAQLLAKENSVHIKTIEADISEFRINKNHWHGIISVFFHIPSVLRKTIHRNVVAGLVPGGVFILEGYSQEQLDYKTGGPTVRELLFDLDEIQAELNNLEFLVNQKTSRTVVEGKYHYGEASVLQILGKKN